MDGEYFPEKLDLLNFYFEAHFKNIVWLNRYHLTFTA